MPCKIVVLPVLRESTITKSESRNSTIISALSPRVIGIPVTIEMNETVGIVNPIVAKEEPSDRFKLF